VRAGRKEENVDGERPPKAIRRPATLRLPASAMPTLKVSLQRRGLGSPRETLLNMRCADKP
jgi:hypothetical protein